MNWLNVKLDQTSVRIIGVGWTLSLIVIVIDALLNLPQN